MEAPRNFADFHGTSMTCSMLLHNFPIDPGYRPFWVISYFVPPVLRYGKSCACSFNFRRKYDIFQGGKGYYRSGYCDCSSGYFTHDQECTHESSLHMITTLVYMTGNYMCFLHMIRPPKWFAARHVRFCPIRNWLCKTFTFCGRLTVDRVRFARFMIGHVKKYR